MTKKSTAKVREEIEEDGEIETAPSSSLFEETNDIRDFSGYDVELQEWVSRENLDKLSYSASLFKYDPINRAKQWLVTQNKDEILTAHDVGLQFGSGEYRYLITFRAVDNNPPRVKAFKFNIHPCYDEKRRKMGAEAPAPTMLSAGRGVSEFGGAMELIKGVVDMLKPLINAQPVAPVDQSGTMLQNYTLMNEVLKKNLMENIALHKDLAGKINNAEPFDEGDDMPEETNWLAQVMPFIESILPKILGDGIQSKATVAAVKALPQFKQIVKDKGEFKKLVDGLTAEVGAEKVAALLKKLKIPA